jgi:hypothetical protein
MGLIHYLRYTSIWCTMGGQKVPGMVVLHYNGRRYGNAYLITLARRHICSINTAIVGNTGGRLFFWTIPEFSCRMVVKCVPSRPTFRVGNSQKSLEARSWEHGVSVMTEMFSSATNCCTTSVVWFDALPLCRHHCTCLPLVLPLPPNCIAQTL